MDKQTFDELQWDEEPSGALMLLDGPYYATIYPPGWLAPIFRHLEDPKREGWFAIAEHPKTKERQIKTFPKDKTEEDVKDWIRTVVFSKESGSSER